MQPVGKTITVPSESHPLATSRNESQQDNPIVAIDADTDTDTDTEYVNDTDSDSDSDNEPDREKRFNISLADAFSLNAEYVPSYTFDQIDILAHAVDEESNGEYPYVTRLVEKFYEINAANNWCGSDGKPITDIVRWYKQYLDCKPHGGEYPLKAASVCEE